MKNRISDDSNNNLQEKMIEQALKTGGFLFPESIEEVKEFERIYGTTDVILPVELQEPTFLYSKSDIGNYFENIKSPGENFAMARIRPIGSGSNDKRGSRNIGRA